MVLYLDPGPGVEWSKVVAAAKQVRSILDTFELQSFVRTSGGKGLHVVVPLIRRATWDVVKELAHAVADFLARNDPSTYVATSSKARRQGKIYADYLRNARGATAIASYSTRARAGAPVATPLDWDELTARVDPGKFNVNSVPERLAARGDAWKGFFEVRQSVTDSMTRKLQS
jgi:bifunctional non-homologous end joining protein LigD